MIGESYNRGKPTGQTQGRKASSNVFVIGSRYFFFLLNFLNIFSFYEFVYITQLIIYNFFSDMVELLADHQVHRAVNTPVELLDLQLLELQDVINEIFPLFLPISSRIQDRKMKFLRLLQQKSKFNAAI